MRVSIDDGILTGIADAIRGQYGETEPISPLDFAELIEAIEGGGSGGLPFSLEYGEINPLSDSENLTIDYTLGKIPQIVLVWKDDEADNPPPSTNCGACMVLKKDGTAINSKIWSVYSGGNGVLYSMELSETSVVATEDTITVKARSSTYSWKANNQYKWLIIGNESEVTE